MTGHVDSSNPTAIIVAPKMTVQRTPIRSAMRPMGCRQTRNLARRVSRRAPEPNVAPHFGGDVLERDHGDPRRAEGNRHDYKRDSCDDPRGSRFDRGE